MSKRPLEAQGFPVEEGLGAGAHSLSWTINAAFFKSQVNERAGPSPLNKVLGWCPGAHLPFINEPMRADPKANESLAVSL